MSDNVRVRVAGRSFGYRGESYAEGDELEVDEATAENHPRTLEVIENGSDEEENTDVSSESETESDYEECGAVMSDGTVCERPADECPYHG